MFEAAMEPIRCVGGVVHDAVGRLLLVLRGTPPSLHRWSLPGGRVEAGESDEAALARELAEETGLMVTVRSLVGSVIRPASRGFYEIFDYECRVIGGQLTAGDDVRAAAWIDDVIFDSLERGGGLSDGLAETLRGWNCLPRR